MFNMSPPWALQWSEWWGSVHVQLTHRDKACKCLEHLIVIVPDVSPGYISLGVRACVCVWKERGRFCYSVIDWVWNKAYKSQTHKRYETCCWQLGLEISPVVPVLVLVNEMIKTWKIILKFQPRVWLLFSEKWIKNEKKTNFSCYFSLCLERVLWFYWYNK